MEKCTGTEVLKLPLKIHAVMQHPHNKQSIPFNPVKDNMRLLANTPQSRGDFLGAAAKLRIIQQGLETGLQLIAIAPGLIDAEFGDSVIGYFGQITGGAPA